MSWKSLVLLVFITTFFSELRCENLTYSHISKSFNPINLLQGLADFNSSSVCSQHVSKLLEDFKSGKSWALLMIDSSAQGFSGLLKGNVLNPGQYDECLEIDNAADNYTGKYCMLEVQAYRKANQSEFNIFGLFSSLEIFQNLELIQYLDDIILGFCVPSTCSATDIVKGINFKLNTSHTDPFLAVNASEEVCKTKNIVESKHFDWSAWGPLLFFIVISLLSTIYDVTYRGFLKDKPNPMFSAFSFYSNGKYLLQLMKDTEQLKCLHGIRVLSTFWIVVHHQFSTLSLGINRFDNVKLVHDVRYIHISYGFIAVDTFFFLSGMLTAIVFFRDIKKKGYYDIPLGYIHRYIRLTPSYAAMIFIVTQVYVHLSDGPLWHGYASYVSSNCERNWWTGLLYVQNFVHPIGMCLGETWYLSADMQLHWFSPLILYTVFFWPAYAKFIFGAALLLSASTNFGIGLIYKLGPSTDLSKDVVLQADVDYYPFYTRAAPYVIGLATGYLINAMRNKKNSIILSKLQVLAGWFMSTVLCLSTLYCIQLFVKFGTESVLGNALYLSLHRVAWGFGLSWIVFACLNGYGGPVNAFLSWDAFQPLSKLSYGVYLVHSSFILYKLGTSRTIHYGGYREMVFDSFAYITISIVLAIPLTLIFEIPFGNLDKYFFQNVQLLPVPLPTKKQTDDIHIGTYKREESHNGENFEEQMEIKSTP